MTDRPRCKLQKTHKSHLGLLGRAGPRAVGGISWVYTRVTRRRRRLNVWPVTHSLYLTVSPIEVTTTNTNHSSGVHCTSRRQPQRILPSRNPNWSSDRLHLLYYYNTVIFLFVSPPPSPILYFSLFPSSSLPAPLYHHLLVSERSRCMHS